MYLVPFVLFMIDYSIYAIDAPLVLSLICYLFFSLSRNRLIPSTLTFCLFLIGLQSFHIDALYPSGFICLITCAISLALRKILIHKWLISFAAVCCVIIINAGWITFLSNTAPLQKNYTTWQLCVNLTILLIMSLIDRVAGSTDNRL